MLTVLLALLALSSAPRTDPGRSNVTPGRSNVARLALTPPRPEPEPPPLLQGTTAVDPRAAAARAAYAAGDYVAAARQYEALARDAAAPKYLFNAGMAREAAGELSLAVLRWTQYLASGTSSHDDRALLASKRAAAEAALVPRRFRLASPAAAVLLVRGAHDPLELDASRLADPVPLEAGEWFAELRDAGTSTRISFTVGPADAAPVVLMASPPPDAPPPPQDPLTGTLTVRVGPPRALSRGVTLVLDGPTGPRRVSQTTPDTTLTLPHSPWRISAEAPDRTSQTRELLVSAAPARLDFELRRSPAARWSKIGVPAGLGAVGLGLAAGGLVLAVRGARHDLTCTDLATCRSAADAVLDTSNGLSLLGTSLGLVVPAATSAAGAPRRALVVEAGLGAALFAGGLSWYLAEAARTTALDHRPREHVAAAVLGLGAGMSSGALIALLVRRIVRPRAPTESRRPALVPLANGLSLHAKF